MKGILIICSLSASLCLPSMEANSGNKLSIINQYLQDIALKLSHYGAKIIDSSIVRIDERTISGNEWVVLSNRQYLLSSPVPADAPYHKWRAWNCKIHVERRQDQEVLISVEPDFLPLMGEYEFNDATWKAQVWLEARASQQNGIDPEEEAEINKRIEELKLCQANLLKERQRLLATQK